MAALSASPTSCSIPNGCIAGADYTAGLFAAVKVLSINLGRMAQDMAF